MRTREIGVVETGQVGRRVRTAQTRTKPLGPLTRGTGPDRAEHPYEWSESTTQKVGITRG